MKDLYIAAHEELIEAYMDTHPRATEAQAYDACADRAYNHMVDRLADRADYERKARREEFMCREADVILAAATVTGDK